ncbi:MAG: protein kinase [Polyangiales bacterium]
MRTCQSCRAEVAEEHRYCPSCGFPIAALRATSGDPLIGRTLGGGYLILEAVGAGGMGRVYRAEQASLGKTLAVKVIHPHLAGEESAVARFYAEARACSRLNHPNCVSVLDFGRTEDGLLFLVMEFLRGQDLARVVWESGQIAHERAAEIIRQVLAALAEAHDQGIIHRDIKPENILVEPLRTGGDFVKMVDFGLAKIRSDDKPGVTSPGSFRARPTSWRPSRRAACRPTRAVTCTPPRWCCSTA